MYTGSSLEEHCYRILEEKGGKIADRVRAILLEEISVNGLEHSLQYLSEKWRDTFAPSMVILSCEAVGGKPNEATYQASLALSLMNLSFSLWDDLLDKTKYRFFIPTVLGKYGEGANLIIGGLSSARAFSILNQMDLDRKKHRAVTELVWNYWKRTARAENVNLRLRKQSHVKAEEKFTVIKTHAITSETLLRVGAVLGDGSEDEIKHLGLYGRYLGIILELRKDVSVSLNLTLELAEKISTGALPYTLLWAENHSEGLKEYLAGHPSNLIPFDIGKLVEFVLEAGAMEEVINLLREFTKKAESELIGINTNNSITKLKLFLQSQERILTDSLSALFSCQH